MITIPIHLLQLLSAYRVKALCLGVEREKDTVLCSKRLKFKAETDISTGRGSECHTE